MLPFAISPVELLAVQTAAPTEQPPQLYPMYLLIIGAAVGAAAQRTLLRNLSPWTSMLAGIIGSFIGGYLGIFVLGHSKIGPNNIAFGGGLVGAIVALTITWLIKRPADSGKAAPLPAAKDPPITISPGPSHSHVREELAGKPLPRISPQASRTSSGDIFISYASADRSFAQSLAKALQDDGWSVWWDRVIPPGKSFDAVIEEALDAAKCVIVLWSKSSVASDWVKVEAAEAARRHILIPAIIDSTTIPLEFRRIQAASLVDWTGSADHLGFQSLVTSIAELATKHKP